MDRVDLILYIRSDLGPSHVNGPVQFEGPLLYRPRVWPDPLI